VDVLFVPFLFSLFRYAAPERRWHPNKNSVCGTHSRSGGNSKKLALKIAVKTDGQYHLTTHIQKGI
jgi:hypothetical protein